MYARTQRRIIYCPRESHGTACAFRGRTKHSRLLSRARPAPLRLGLLIVLELLVRRIIELQLLPRVMKVDATAVAFVRPSIRFVRASRSCERSPRRLMKTKPSPLSLRRGPSKQLLPGEDVAPSLPRVLLYYRRFVSSRAATVRSYLFSFAIFRLPLSRSTAAPSSAVLRDDNRLIELCQLSRSRDNFNSQEQTFLAKNF